MWPLNETPGLLTDLYELTMAQAYFNRRMTGRAWFEVTIRRLPDRWGYFVMAGLEELADYLDAFAFSAADLDFLDSLGLFSSEFLHYLSTFHPRADIRALPEGTVFFPEEPILEAGGPLMDVQLLEPYVLNIIGFSTVTASLAARIMQAARGRSVIDFGFRRAQGPLAALRAARAGQMAGFAATSNVLAARLLNMPPSGTMAHSYIEVHKNEEEAFRLFCELYRERAILLVDTYDIEKGIRIAARVARDFYKETGVRIRGIRIDSGDFIASGRFAREHFRREGVDFLKIFVSSSLDEYVIDDLTSSGAEIDGFGIGASFTACREAPSVDIIYKISQYEDRPLFKTSPDKVTRAGRKTLRRRMQNDCYVEDVIVPCRENDPQDLLVPFTIPELMAAVQQRLQQELARLPAPVKHLRTPASYPVRFNLPA